MHPDDTHRKVMSTHFEFNSFHARKKGSLVSFVESNDLSKIPFIPLRLFPVLQREITTLVEIEWSDECKTL